MYYQNEDGYLESVGKRKCKDKKLISVKKIKRMIGSQKIINYALYSSKNDSVNRKR